MLIKIPKGTVIYPLQLVDPTHLKVDDMLARMIHWDMLFEDFKEDFGNFLSSQHEDSVIPDGDRYISWKVLWETFQELQDQNVAAWDTFEDVFNEAWNNFGHFECIKCNKKLLGNLPEVDRDGNVYCDKCANEYTDFCELCDERYLKSDLKYDEDGAGYCKNCYHDYKHADE